MTSAGNPEISRRWVLGAGAAGLSALGAASVSRARADALGDQGLTAREVAEAEEVAGVAYSKAERAQMLPTLADQLESIRMLRTLEKPNNLQPASVFNPRVPGVTYATQSDAVTAGALPSAEAPGSDEDVAFAPVWRQRQWLDAGVLSSRQLTDIYLARIERIGPILECFISVTVERARTEADSADREMRAGRHRGALHGIPYGLKDLFDAEGAPTTWGGEPWMNRAPATADCIVAARLKDAGAVLLGKTTTGAIAYGDVWFNGKTRNPWNVEEGSSGSSAGSASATAAGLVSFGIGTETMGSIISPSNRCGTAGLRPTFGRTPRSGAMALCWSLDKVGALTRDVLDAAFVLDAIKGADISDASSFDHGFAYDGGADARGLRVGYDPAWFEEAGAHDRAALEAARAAGATLVETRMPDLPSQVFGLALLAESAAAFEELTLSNKDDTLDWQADAAWPNTFRAARFITAVDYIQVDRVRRRAMHEMHEWFSSFDAMIGPNFAGGMLTVTNFTGQPQLAFRSGFEDTPTRTLFGVPIEGAPSSRVPMASSLWAPLFEERTLIRLGRAIQRELGVAEERPRL